MTVKVGDVVSYFEKICPKNLSEDWDNAGLLIGNPNAAVTKILVCLDVDKSVADEAAERGANLIISHHPAIFHPLKKIIKGSEDFIFTLIKNDISVFCAHTNLDVAAGGLNDYLAEKLGLSDTEILVPTGVCGDKKVGYGRYAELKEPKRFGDILKETAKKLNTKNLRYSGSFDTVIKKIAVNSGGGASMAEFCFDNDIDLYITGDFKYSSMRDCADKNLCVIDAGHYETEIIVCEWFQKKIKEKFDITVLKSENNKNVIKFLKYE